MMIVALVLFAAVILACLMAPSEGTRKAKAHAAPAAAPQSIAVGEARA